MGATLQSIINVAISLLTAVVQTKGFGRGLILGSSNRFTGGVLYKIYTTAAAMLTDGFLVTDPEYLAAVAYFSPNPAPQDVMIGYAPTDTTEQWTITPTAHDTTLYTVTINGVASTFTSGSGATAAQIVTGLAAAINAQSPALPVVTSGTNTLIVTSTTAGLAFTLTVGANLSAVNNVAEADPATALTNIVNQGGTGWYALMLTSRNDQDILDAAAWIETNGGNGLYVFLGCNQDSAILTNVSTDLLSLLAAKTYLRTGFIWSDNQAAFPEAVWLGLMLPGQPGSSNFAWKTLPGVTPTALSVLTPTAVAQLAAKNGNFYSQIAGVNVTQPGVQVGGQFMDVVWGRDWIQSQMQSRIFSLLVNNPKINFDDSGIGLIANVARGVLKDAITFGILTSYTLTPPPASSISSTQKGTRILPPIPFTGVLAGAVNGLTINGTITN